MRLKIAIWLFSTLLFSVASATETERLLLRLSQERGTDRVNTYIDLSRAYYEAGDTLAVYYADRAIELSKRLGFHEGVGKGELFKGLAIAETDPLSALPHYITSSDLLAKQDHPWAHYGYKNAADFYINNGWLPEALDFTKRILDINRRFGDTLLLAESKSSMGMIHQTFRNYDEALVWERRALNLLEGKQAEVMRGLVLGRIGIIYDYIGQLDSANYYNEKAIKLFREAGEVNYVSQWLSNLANTLMRQSRYREAEGHLTAALSEEIHNDRKAIIYSNLGRVYTQTGRYQLAEQMLDSAYKYATQYNFLRFLSEVYFRRYELSEAQGNLADALAHYKRYSELNDSLINITKAEQVSMMLARYNMEETERALLTERADKELMEKEWYRARLRATRAYKWILGIGVVSLLLIMHIWMRMQRTRRRIRAEKELAVMAEQERGLIAVIRAQDEERQRVAKDLHDGIGQQVNALWVNFQVLLGKIKTAMPAFAPEAEKLKRMIWDTGQEIRGVSHQMMPRALVQFGLVDALEDMLESSFRNTKIFWLFNHKEIEERLPKGIEIGLYRVAQELVSNILKHSEATHVTIRLKRTNTICTFEIEDNGKGMKQQYQRGIGLNNISNRVIAMKGKFNIDTAPGDGFRALISIPISYE